MTIPRIIAPTFHIDRSAEPPLRFFALGDTGSGDQNQYQVAAAMEKRCLELPKLDGMLLLGDLFYMSGVSSTQDKQWDEKLVKPYSTPCLAAADIFPIFGNHDYVGNKEAFLEYGKVNDRWKMPNRFYSVNFSSSVPGDSGDLVRFIAIDSNYPDFCFSPEHCVADFMVQELKKPAQWKIVLAHHPLASASLKKNKYNGETAYGYFYRWLACGKADEWISGHAHHLEHRKLDTCATELFVSGGGGGDLEDIESGNPDMKFGSSEFGFLELEISENTLKTRFLNIEGKVIYEKETRK